MKFLIDADTPRSLTEILDHIRGTQISNKEIICSQIYPNLSLRSSKSEGGRKKGDRMFSRPPFFITSVDSAYVAILTIDKNFFTLSFLGFSKISLSPDSKTLPSSKKII